MSKFIKSNNELHGDVTINNGKLTTTGGGDTTLADNTGADVDIESPNNLKFKVGNDKFFQFYDDGDIINEMQGGSSGYNLKMYDADSPSNGSIDFAHLTVGTNGELFIGTTSLSDADINIGCVTGQVCITSDLQLSNNKKLYFDGNGNTYIQHPTSPGDKLNIYVGSANMVSLTESGSDGNTFDFEDCAVGFTRREQTFSTTDVKGTGGTDDTDIDFRKSNKFRLEMTGDIAQMNLIFPPVSGNFLLVTSTNGDHDVTAWKVWESDETAATTTDVMWAGGSVPAFTNNGVDITSFYWDADEQQCYGVCSLAFATP